jgi:hypothetical protein
VPTRHPASRTAAPAPPVARRVVLLAASLVALACPAADRGADESEVDPPEASAAVENAPGLEPAGLAPDDVETGPIAPCPELVEGSAMLDNVQRGVERSVCVTAWRFDRLFGVLPEDQIVEHRVSHGRLRLGMTWNERDGFEEEVAMRVQVRLPVAERRARLVFGRDTDEAFIEGGSREFDGTTFDEEDQDRSWLLGLGYEPIRGTRSRLGLGAGVRLGTPPDPFVQASYWFQTRLREELLLRARQTVFWENEDGFGTATRVSLERVLANRRLLRWSNHLRLTETTDGVRWNTNLTLYQALAFDRAIALRGAIRGETGREVNPIEYNLRLIHRQRILRDWLFLELQGGGGWRRERPEESRDFVPEAAVIFEMGFGRRLPTPDAGEAGST